MNLAFNMTNSQVCTDFQCVRKGFKELLFVFKNSQWFGTKTISNCTNPLGLLDHLVVIC